MEGAGLGRGGVLARFRGMRLGMGFSRGEGAVTSWKR